MNKDNVNASSNTKFIPMVELRNPEYIKSVMDSIRNYFSGKTGRATLSSDKVYYIKNVVFGMIEHSKDFKEIIINYFKLKGQNVVDEHGNLDSNLFQKISDDYITKNGEFLREINSMMTRFKNLINYFTNEDSILNMLSDFDKTLEKSDSTNTEFIEKLISQRRFFLENTILCIYLNCYDRTVYNEIKNDRETLIVSMKSLLSEGIFRISTAKTSLTEKEIEDHFSKIEKLAEKIKENIKTEILKIIPKVDENMQIVVNNDVTIANNNTLLLLNEFFNKYNETKCLSLYDFIGLVCNSNSRKMEDQVNFGLKNVKNLPDIIETIQNKQNIEDVLLQIRQVFDTQGYREVDLIKTNTFFANTSHPEEIASKIKQLNIKFKKALSETNLENFLRECADIYADYIQIHPYQDGNGRTDRILIIALMASKGLYFPSLFVTEEGHKLTIDEKIVDGDYSQIEDFFIERFKHFYPYINSNVAMTNTSSNIKNNPVMSVETSRAIDYDNATKRKLFSQYKESLKALRENILNSRTHKKR